MGTSKGYIPPKSAEWRRAKGAVTRMSGGNYDRENVGKAVSKFAEAYATTHLPNSNAGVVAGNVLNFIQSIQSNGVNQTLDEIGLSALLDKDGMELYNGIVDYFATDIASTDGQAIRDSLLETLKVLEIQTVDDFSQHDSGEFLTKALKEIEYDGDFTLEADGLLEKIPKELLVDTSRFMPKVSRYLIGVS